ncbi:hypothetical protein JSY14_01110 [Brachybacterium sp. EF45031]|uniref:prepilin peptidase n=1 Tax=Brachybacterium sillae TaxID=2810536 RepID=UPI00217DEF5C|nr:prepilin peptidase [Brachybacterium sillae]MCS6710687.1 hypothetical protein [Brachybacterium sillae]
MGADGTTVLWSGSVLACALLPWAILLTLHDVRSHRLPNPLVAGATLAVFGTAALCWLALPGDREVLAWSVGIGLAVGAAAVVLALLSPALLGMGDAKLLGPVAVVAVAAGPVALLGSMVVGLVVACCWAIAAALRAGTLRTRFPAGPAILVAPYGGLLVGALGVG